MPYRVIIPIFAAILIYIEVNILGQCWMLHYPGSKYVSDEDKNTSEASDTTNKSDDPPTEASENNTELGEAENEADETDRKKKEDRISYLRFVFFFCCSVYLVLASILNVYSITWMYTSESDAAKFNLMKRFFAMTGLTEMPIHKFFST